MVSNMVGGNGSLYAVMSEEYDRSALRGEAEIHDIRRCAEMFDKFASERAMSEQQVKLAKKEKILRLAMNTI